MIRFFLTAGLVLMLSAPLLLASDLYLINISNSEQVRLLTEVVGMAKGQIEGAFLVDLNITQVSNLRSAGLVPKLLYREYGGESLCLIQSREPGTLKSLEGITPLYSGKQFYLTKAADVDKDRLERRGFVVQIMDNTGIRFSTTEYLLSFLSDEGFPTDTLADLINQDSLLSYVHRLEAFGTRYLYSDSTVPAANWILEKFRDFGYMNAYFDPYLLYTFPDPNGWPCNNVVCYKTGSVNPEKYIVIGAHYDTWSENTTNLAPGADDNASGTAAVLELARILKNYDNRNTIIFASFAAEEIYPYSTGSKHMAGEFYQQGADVTFMLNSDMIGYAPGDVDTAFIFYGNNIFYAPALSAAASRISDLPSILTQGTLGSDESSFYSRGYAAAWITESINPRTNPHYHLYHDSAIYLDFDFMKRQLRYMAATIGQVDNALSPPDFTFRDGGDGQSLRVEIADCQMENSYTIFYGPDSGTWQGLYPDTIVITPQMCYCDLTGLPEGQTCYVAAQVKNPDGNYSMVLREQSFVPRQIPHPPVLQSVAPDSLSITIVWKPNTELDLKQYRLLRRDSSLPWSTVADGILDTTYRDIDVLGHHDYTYALLAQDDDDNLSDTSATMGAIPASFDYPLLLIDETAFDSYAPAENIQNQFYNFVLNGVPFDKVNIDDTASRLSRSKAGEYGTIYWSDDDNSSRLLNNSLDSLHWYLGYGVNMFLEGWQTVYAITGPSYFYPGNLFYDHFGLSRVQINGQSQFIGADGEGDWPDLDLNPGAPIFGQMSNITVFDAAPNAGIILRFRSNVPGSYFDGKPVGVAYNTGFGKRVVLGFPIFYLTEASAQALVQKVLAYFVEPTPHYGDVNHDGRVNIQDITFLINYLYKGGPAPSALNDADANGDCSINIRDITYLIKYLYQDGAVPVVGCVD
jgi:Peptidase family M28/Dockerin type I domain